MDHIVRLHCIVEDDYSADEAKRASYKEKYKEQKQKDIIDETFITVTIWIRDIYDPRLSVSGSLFEVFPATGTCMFGLNHQMTAKWKPQSSYNVFRHPIIRIISVLKSSLKHYDKHLSLHMSLHLATCFIDCKT